MKIILPNGVSIQVDGVCDVYDGYGRCLLNSFSTIEIRPVAKARVDDRNYDWCPVKDDKIVNQDQFNEGLKILQEFVNAVKLARLGNKTTSNHMGLINFLIIPAIKEVRTKTNGCLKESKDFVDYVANLAMHEEIGPGYNYLLVKHAMYHIQSTPKLLNCEYSEYLKDIPLFNRQSCIQEDEFWAARTLIKAWGLPETNRYA